MLIARLFVPLFTFYERAMPDARERIPTAPRARNTLNGGSASLPRHERETRQTRGSAYYAPPGAAARNE